MFPVDRHRLAAQIETLAGFSDAPAPAVTRVVYSRSDLAARAYLAELAAEIGLTRRTDPLGNTFFRWEGRNPELPAVATGSHIDAIPHAPEAFWAAFCGRLRERLARVGKGRFLLLGEVFDADPEVLARYTALDQLDAAFAFDLKDALINRVILGGAPPVVARGALVDNRRFFPSSGQPNGVGLDPWTARVAFGDNHDVFRLRGELDDPLAAHIALTAVLTVDAIPALYYGTEQGLDGRLHHEAREPLWEAGYERDHPTFEHLRRLIALRRRSVALRRGGLVVRYASESGGADEEPSADAGMIAWEREVEGERLLVVINAAIQTSEATIPTGFRGGVRLYDALGGAEAPWGVGEGGRVTVRLPGRASVVLEPR